MELQNYIRRILPLNINSFVVTSYIGRTLGENLSELNVKIIVLPLILWIFIVIMIDKIKVCFRKAQRETAKICILEIHMGMIVTC